MGARQQHLLGDRDVIGEVEARGKGI